MAGPRESRSRQSACITSVEGDTRERRNSGWRARQRTGMLAASSALRRRPPIYPEAPVSRTSDRWFVPMGEPQWSSQCPSGTILTVLAGSLVYQMNHPVAVSYPPPEKDAERLPLADSTGGYSLFIDISVLPSMCFPVGTSGNFPVICTNQGAKMPIRSKPWAAYSSAALNIQLTSEALLLPLGISDRQAPSPTRQAAWPAALPA